MLCGRGAGLRYPVAIRHGGGAFIAAGGFAVAEKNDEVVLSGVGGKKPVCFLYARLNVGILCAIFAGAVFNGRNRVFQVLAIRMGVKLVPVVGIRAAVASRREQIRTVADNGDAVALVYARVIRGVIKQGVYRVVCRIPRSRQLVAGVHAGGRVQHNHHVDGPRRCGLHLIARHRQRDIERIGVAGYRRGGFADGTVAAVKRHRPGGQNRRSRFRKGGLRERDHGHGQADREKDA